MVTNYIKSATYKEIYDIHNDTNSTSILTFHSPVTKFPRQMLGGFFAQYRRFKYRGMRVSVVPAATLPANPEQIGWTAGEPTIDARDMLNPALFRGYCGDSLGKFLNTWISPGQQARLTRSEVGGSYTRSEADGWFGSSIDLTSFPNDQNNPMLDYDLRSQYLDKLYYQSLSDPKFSRVYPQRRWGKRLYPLVYELATTTQRLAHNYMNGASAPIGAGVVDRIVYQTSGQYGPTTDNTIQNRRDDANDASDMSTEDMGTNALNYGSTKLGAPVYFTGETNLYTNTTTGSNRVVTRRVTTPILTSNKRRLGWLDTDTRVVEPVVSSESGVTPGSPVDINSTAPYQTDYIALTQSLYPDAVTTQTVLPLINMGVMILPKAHKTENYMRVVCTHYFDFKDYRPLCGLVSPFDDHGMLGPSLEWSDWDDTTTTYPSPSITSTSKNVDLVDVVQSGTDPFETQ